jgi:hypothetical protein
MPADSTNDGKNTRSSSYPLVLTLFSGLSFVLLLVLLYFAENKLETLENQLRSRAPTASQAGAIGNYGIEIVDGQTVYVPVYSHIYTDGGKPHLLETTLSIRNLDPKHGIMLKSVKYFDTGGAMLKEHLETELRLGPLETTSFLVKKQDTHGGSGANFIVVWDAEEPVYEPLIEAIMVGFFDGGASISFSSPGRALIKRKD